MTHSKIPKYLFILPFLWAPPRGAADLPPLTPSTVVANDSGTIVVRDAIGNSINDFSISNGNNINIAAGNVDTDAEDEIVINNNGQILPYPIDENALPEFFMAKSHDVFANKFFLS